MAVYALDSYTYDSSIKEENFVLHSLENPVLVGGQETQYIMDTNFIYGFKTPEQARLGSLFKPIGLPKSSLNFFLSAPLIKPLELSGQWKASIWVNSTAYKPVGFTVELLEISSSGSVIYTTGQQSPIVISSIGEHLDVQVTNYVLVSPINHVFQEGSAIEVRVEVNAGSSSETRIWFDAPMYPSKVILPCMDYARPVSMKTYNWEGIGTDAFDIDAASDKRIVEISANVTDPFGGYDIASVKLDIFYNNTQRVAGPMTMTFVDFEIGQRLYAINWTYPSNMLRGNYSAVISVVDNNGVYFEKLNGNPDPFIESATHPFVLGPIVYYNPRITIRDADGEPVPEAQVFVSYPNVARDELPLLTDMNGTIVLTKIVPANYSLTVVWKNSVVAHSGIYVDSDGPFNVIANVYSLTVTVVDNGDKPVSEAYVFAYRDRLGYGFGATDEEGAVVFKVPSGIYDLETHFSSTYLLSHVSSNFTKPDLSIGESTQITLKLNDYPPPLWTTIGFMVVLTGAVLLVVILMIIRRN
jgi:hypothetical protein